MLFLKYNAAIKWNYYLIRGLLEPKSTNDSIYNHITPRKSSCVLQIQIPLT